MLPGMPYQYSKALDNQRRTTGYAKDRQTGDLQPVHTLVTNRVLLSNQTIFGMWPLDFEACRKIPWETCRCHRHSNTKVNDTQDSPGQ